ncbi:SPOR domain-containing protein [Borreliella afzelii]|uniref:SPOR domain-containing protein n=1 Tax=Borreliella afzelii TaxID=29518 RepID=UPI001BA68FA6|nr:SPOR domain-containing protein [Borreliella afzelii]QUG72938.1 SPOR domain-containing protein [Borreliella afzelii]
MKDLNENNDNNKGFFVALTSIATVCIIIFLGTIIFFPNKNLTSDIAEKNIVLEETKDQNTLENVDQNEKSLKVSETPNEIIIDLTQDLNKEKKTTPQKIPNTSQKSKIIEKSQPTQKIPNTSKKSKIIEKPQPTPQKIPNTSQKSKIIEKSQPVAQKDLNIDNIYDPNTEYYIQFVSLSDPINADNYIQKLLKYNIVAKIYSATVDNKDIYRVRSGPYKTKSEAKADFKKIAGISEFKETYILPINK